MYCRPLFTGARMAEGRLCFEARTPEAPAAPREADAAREAPARNPPGARRERVETAKQTINKFENNIVNAIKKEFNMLRTAGGKTAADAKNAIEARYTGFTLELDGENLKNVQKNSIEPAKTKLTTVDELKQSGLSEEQKTAVDRALDQLKTFSSSSAQFVEFLAADGDVDVSHKRIDALANLKTEGIEDILSGTPVAGYRNCMDAIIKGDFAALKTAKDGGDAKITKLMQFMEKNENRETVMFIAVINKDLQSQATKNNASSPEKNTADAQTELDTIAADPNLSPEDAAMKKGAVMAKYGVNIKEEAGGKLTAVPADPKSQWEGLTNRLAGAVAWMSALGAKLKGITKGITDKAKGVTPAGPDGKKLEAKENAASKEDPVDPKVREDLKTKDYGALDADLKAGGGGTFDSAKNIRDAALAVRDAAKTAADNSRTAFTAAERAFNEDTSDPKDPAKKTTMENAKRDLDAKELDLKQKEELLKPKEEEFKKKLDEQKALTKSKTDFDKMYVDIDKNVKKASSEVNGPLVKDIKEAKDLSTLITTLTLGENANKLTIKAGDATLLDDPVDPAKPTLKSMLTKYGMDASVCEHDGETVKKPRALSKAIATLAEKIKTDNTSAEALKTRYSKENLVASGAPDGEAEVAAKYNDPTPILKYSIDAGWELMNIDSVSEEQFAKRIADAFCANKDAANNPARETVVQKLDEYLKDLTILPGRMVLKSILKAEAAPAEAEGNIINLQNKLGAGKRVLYASDDAGKICWVTVTDIEQGLNAPPTIDVDDVGQWVINKTDTWRNAEIRKKITS